MFGTSTLRRPATLLAILALLLTTSVAWVVAGPASRAAAAVTCAAPWSASTIYTNGAIVSYGGSNWKAGWWTTQETPGTTGEWGVWRSEGTCGGSTTPTPTPTTTPTETPETPSVPGDFIVSEAQFNQMFPNRSSFYTYAGLVAALDAYPEFAQAGGTEIAKREAAAFLANVNHETGGLVYVKEINTANYSHYCDWSQSYGCPAGQSAYYGRGPIQLSWNFNYKAAATPSASTCSTTRPSSRRTRPSPGRPASGTGTRRPAQAP